MKFVHIADIHFDTAFTLLNTKENLGEIRRLEQRKIFKKVIDYIKENKIPYLFISGDLYEQKYVRPSTIEYINHEFQRIPETQIFISPGNHDPYIKNSYYKNMAWNHNVKIFKNEIEKIETKEADIYGYGFTEFYCENLEIEKIKIENKEKINILIIHGTLDGSNQLEKLYNPIKSNEIKKVGFDYVALGHIHKTNYKESTNLIYPGSMNSLGFDEPGEHGMIIGDIDKHKLNIEFIPLDEIYFEEKEIDITQINYQEELIEQINEIKSEKSKYKIILNGVRNFEINIYNIKKLISNESILKIEDNTKMKYNLEEIVNQNNLKGLFIKNMLKKKEEGKYTEEDIQKAIELGLEIL